MVRLAVRDGPAAVRSWDSHSDCSFGVSSRPSSRSQREACPAKAHRRLKLVLFRSRAMPIKTPVDELLSRSHPALCSASAAVCSMSSCCGSISSISRGGIRKRLAGSVTSSIVKPANGVASSLSVWNHLLSDAPCQPFGGVGTAAVSPPSTRSWNARSDCHWPKRASMPTTAMASCFSCGGRGTDNGGAAECGSHSSISR